MPLLSGPRSGRLQSEILRIGPEEVHQLLCPAGQVASQWLSVPDLTNGPCVSLPLPGWLSSTLFYQSLPHGSFITYRRGLVRPSGQPSPFKAGHSRNQMDPRIPRSPTSANYE